MRSQAGRRWSVQGRRQATEKATPEGFREVALANIVLNALHVCASVWCKTHFVVYSQQWIKYSSKLCSLNNAVLHPAAVKTVIFIPVDFTEIIRKATKTSLCSSIYTGSHPAEA